MNTWLAVAWISMLLSGCQVIDRFRDASREECSAAAQHVVMIGGGENAGLGRAVIEFLAPGAVERLLKPAIDICATRASRYDVDCMLGATTQAELGKCEFFTKHWQNL